ncbi:MAG: hypothetical protein Fur006_25860 [Coleofasciculaceae cyanobacterium]
MGVCVPPVKPGFTANGDVGGGGGNIPDGWLGLKLPGDEVPDDELELDGPGRIGISVEALSPSTKRDSSRRLRLGVILEPVAILN